MNATNQAELADPVQVLPKENLLQIFSYLSQHDIDASSKVNHIWRDSIQSDFSLFTCIEVKDSDAFYSPGENPDPWWDEEDAKLQAMRTTIGHLSRLANLSNNRLKQVLIGLAAFGGCIPKSTGGWRFSRLSVVFDILTLSSHTLTKLQLDFPQTIMTENSVKAAGEYIETVLVKLAPFPHLKEVELRALPSNLEIISKSKNKNLKVSSYSSHHRSYCCHSCQPHHQASLDPEVVSFLLPLSGVVRDISAFTGGQISHLGRSFEECGLGPPPFLDGPTWMAIRDSAETLEKLEVCTEFGLLLLPNLVSKCPQLVFLKLYSESPDPLDSDPLDWEITLPIEDVQESKLMTLAISLEGPGRIVINQSMLKWVGFSLEVLIVKTRISEESVLADYFPLHLLMHAVGRTLKTLEIKGFYNFFWSMNQLDLSVLNKLELSGNAGLIDGFLSAHHCPSLTHLHIEDVVYQEYGGDKVKLDRVYNLVRANSASLETLLLSDHVLGRNESIVNSEPEDKVHEAMNFSRLVKLNLSFYFEGESGPFSRSNLPELKELRLSPALEVHHNGFCLNAPQLTKKKEQTPITNNEENEVAFNPIASDLEGIAD